MTAGAPIWPARIHHFRRDSDDPERLSRFYEQGLGLARHPLGADSWRLSGADRRLVIGRGARGALPYFAYDLGSPGRVAAMRQALAEHQLPILPSPSPLFDADAFAVADPDGRQIVFGWARSETPDLSAAPAACLPGRLQHVVVASTQLGRMLAFYEDTLGLVVSDRVLDDAGDLTAVFLRSDPEHHSFAVFRAPESRPDHHAYETTGWNDIRDWADHLATLQVPLWWGPGRHGPGNNLFFMIEDPDGHKLELSAELEVMPRDMAARDWKHEQRTLNLWGQAWMRS
jgi:catechol 2,3-dioxygenase-like lactoylglutathione lyase family enzyme